MKLVRLSLVVRAMRHARIKAPHLGPPSLLLRTLQMSTNVLRAFSSVAATPRASILRAMPSAFVTRDMKEILSLNAPVRCHFKVECHHLI